MNLFEYIELPSTKNITTYQQMTDHIKDPNRIRMYCGLYGCDVRTRYSSTYIFVKDDDRIGYRKFSDNVVKAFRYFIDKNRINTKDMDIIVNVRFNNNFENILKRGYNI